jgi:hypothetical protein
MPLLFLAALIASAVEEEEVSAAFFAWMFAVWSNAVLSGGFGGLGAIALDMTVESTIAPAIHPAPGIILSSRKPTVRQYA